MAEREEPSVQEELERAIDESEQADSLTDLIDVLRRESFQRRCEQRGFKRAALDTRPSTRS